MSLGTVVTTASLGAAAHCGTLAEIVSAEIAPSTEWQAQWERNILAAAQTRYCETEMGEEIGWLMSPILKGFYYGYMATHETVWIDRLIDWTDSWIRRGVQEPDGYIGWPKRGAAGTYVDNLNSYYADSLLGEAMALRPVVLMSGVILNDPVLKARFGKKADDYLQLSRSLFEKWDTRGAWRPTGSGIISVVLPVGIDQKTGRWTRDHDGIREGFSHPDNKANLTALWLLAMFEATGDTMFRDRAAQWFAVMKSRMHARPDGTFALWNYWEPAGSWDYQSDGVPKHWIGTHPNPGYYDIDVDAISTAYTEGVVFTKDDISRLVKTEPQEGRSWPGLARYDAATRRQLEQQISRGGWATLSMTPWYFAYLNRQAK